MIKKSLPYDISQRRDFRFTEGLFFEGLQLSVERMDLIQMW
jgi:hypothetical protein